MLTKLSSLLIITNLYPVPWAPNRASFNKQQFDLLSEHLQINLIVLMPWTEWFQQRSFWKKHHNIIACPYFYFPKIGRRFVPFFQYLSLLFMLPWIKKSKPTAMLASWCFPDAIAAAKLNLHLKLPFFVKVHGTDVNENCQYLPRRKLIKNWLSSAKVIFCASKALGDKLVDTGIPQEKICVNYNGVNPKIFFPAPKKKSIKKLVFVGSLIPTKGVNELVIAFINLSKRDFEVTLDIIGGGPMIESLKKLASEHGLIERMKIHGSIPLKEVAGFIRRANFLVLPSYREGVPNVLLESFASATPVIATNVGGIPEVVTEDTGIIVDAQNSVALEKAIENAFERNWVTDKILQHAKTFDWQRNINNVLEHMV
ncbi:glycosyltransferase [Thalassotalea castellviae]|uniref:Glycosyltransferase n=1 Tax=Thalassotalea castellviae TaxID=3075612 RepID=A0ABU3A1Z4_9GAMM|nr:glycosyltransferase [Thalassotalea sp. W431]MDT0603815.1 glycosyltransferase [Thalassotalea sp. W431]